MQGQGNKPHAATVVAPTVVGGAGDAGTGRRLGVAEGRARARGVGALVAQCVSESVCEDHPRHQDHHVELMA